MLTYWLTTEDRMKRLSRIESYMSEKQSPTNHSSNNNIDSNPCDSEMKCDTHCEYSVPSGFSSDSEARPGQLNRPPLQRQEHSDQMSLSSEGYENCVLDKGRVHLNSVVPLTHDTRVDVDDQRKYENHIEMTPLLSGR